MMNIHLELNRFVALSRQLARTRKLSEVITSGQRYIYVTNLRS